MKQPKLNLKWEIFLALIVFVCIALAIMWTVQITLNNSLPGLVTINEIKETAEAIEENIDNPDVDVLISNLAYRNGVSIVVIDNQGVTQWGDNSGGGIISQLSDDSLKAKFETANGKNGEYLESQKLSDLNEMNFEIDKNGTEKESRIFTKIITSKDGAKYAVIVESADINGKIIDRTTIITLSVSSGILVIGTVILAFLMSRYIAKPIVSLNISAKDLAKSKYDVKFSGKGYKEVEELSDSLNKASEELSEVDHYRKELIANVSHDLRTPLTLIKGYAEMMIDIPSEVTEENLQLIVDETSRLTGLVNDMLELSKMENGSQKLNCVEFDLISVIASIRDRFSAMIERKGYKIEFINADDKAIVYADQAKIMQVVYNLISNAVNYAGEDKLVRIKEYKKNNKVRIEVIDNGVGIDVKDIPYIWDRYYKSDKNHIRSEVGTGLGLSIVKNVISAHQGGSYGVESSIGQGSRFFFELPIK